MAFCDHCSCSDCRDGTPFLTHALTEWGDHICDVCYRYSNTVRWQRACGHPVDPDVDGYRPRLVGEFTTGLFDEPEEVLFKALEGVS